jgi:hypothetical protein
VPPVHPADGRCALTAFNASCPLRWQAAPGPSCRRRTCPVRCQIVRPCCAAHCVHHPLYEKLPLHDRCYTDLGCQGGRRLLQQQTLVVPSATSVMFLGPHAGAQYPCTCPLSYKRGGMQRYRGDLDTCSIFRLRLSILKLPQQSNTQWNRVLRSGDPNHSKSSRVHVLDVRLAGHAKRLSPFLILGFRAGALRHPGEEFPLRQRRMGTKI